MERAVADIYQDRMSVWIEYTNDHLMTSNPERPTDAGE